LPSSNGYGGDILINNIIDYGFLTSALGGANNSGLFDYYYQNTGNRVALVGHAWGGGLRGGPLSWYLSDSSTYRSRTIGARSQYIPDPYSNV